MITDKNTSKHINNNVPRSSLPRLAIIGASAFIALLGFLHFLEPQFDPSWRLISEYELGNYGWMMRLAFFSFALGSISLLVTLRTQARSVAGYIGLGLMLVIAIGVILGGIFTTDPITNATHTTHGSLHQLGGGLSFPVMPLAALLVSLSLTRRNAAWKAARKPILWTMLLIWLSVITYIVIGAITSSKGEASNPDVVVGVPNRAAVIFYNLWVIIVAWYALRLRRTSKTTR